MEIRESELGEQETEAAARIRKLKLDNEQYLWPDQFMPASFEQAERSLRRSRKAKAHLHEQRSAIWEAIDTAMARQAELQQVGVALRTEGMQGLRRLLNRRRVSPALKNYLERLL